MSDILEQAEQIITERAKQYCSFYTLDGWHCPNPGVRHALSHDTCRAIGIPPGGYMQVCDEHWAFIHNPSTRFEAEEEETDV